MRMHLKPKYPEYVEYHAQSKWDGQTGGISIVSDDRQIAYDTPTTYGGQGKGICPDELFVSAVLGCLNNTFLDFQRRFELELISLDLKGKATAKFDGQGYKIESLSVSCEVVVGKDELETGQRCVELMREYCHLTRSIKACIPIIYETTVRED
ncbi:MAG: OsmC family protein [Candidatus Thorarchaeota archaeon]